MNISEFLHSYYSNSRYYDYINDDLQTW